MQASGFVLWPGLGVGNSGPLTSPGPDWEPWHCRGSRANLLAVVRTLTQKEGPLCLEWGHRQVSEERTPPEVAAPP